MSAPTGDVPDNANEHCPGVGAPGAGAAPACAGCPNQATCADGGAVSAAAAAAAADAAAVAARLAGVKAVLLVLSGKGGVGKSTLAAQLALACAGAGKAAGLCDLDVCGPSIPRMAGVGGRDVHASGSGWAPVYADEDAFTPRHHQPGHAPADDGSLAVMSIGFLLPDPDGAVVWRGPRKHALITKFLRDVDWGELDVLVVDTPPGTSDEHMAAAALLLGGGGGSGGGGSGGGEDGASPGGASSPGPRVAALIVTTPQEVALADVRKEVSFCKKVGLPILGVVENMAALAVPATALAFSDGARDATRAVAAAVDAALGEGAWARLAATAPIFHTEGQSGDETGGEALARRAGAPFLGRVPLDPALGRAGEEGRSVLVDGAAGPSAVAVKAVVGAVLTELGV